MPMTSNLTRCHFFLTKTVNINVLLSVTLKLALVLANRYYCDVNSSYHNVCAKCAHDFKLNKVPLLS